MVCEPEKVQYNERIKSILNFITVDLEVGEKLEVDFIGEMMTSISVKIETSLINIGFTNSQN